MRPKPILPYVFTLGITTSYNRIREVATEAVGVTTAETIIHGRSGCGKSELVRKVSRELAWRGQPGDYGSKIMFLPGGFGISHVELDNVQQTDLAIKAGLLNEDVQAEEEKFYTLMRNRREESGCHSRASGEIVWGWFRFIAERMGLPRPDPIACLPLWGITEKVKNRYPIVLEAMVNDKPSHLLQKLLLILGQDGRRLRHFMSAHICELLSKMPTVLIVDEADVLHEESLCMLRQVADLSGTPLVLAGTDRLRTRLLNNPLLRPLATRVGMRIELGAVTLPDLRKSLPGMDDDIVSEVFRQGGEVFRTICILLGGLRKFQVANPGRRITREIVQMVARRVLTALGTKSPKGAPLDERDPVFTEDDLGLESSEGGHSTALPMDRLADTRAKRKVG